MLAHTSPAQHVGMVAVAIALTALYGRGWIVGHASPTRLWCWVGGVIALLASTSPAMETISAESFTGHMVQHIVMIVVAAPLLVLSRPIATMLPQGGMPVRVRRASHAMGRTWHRTAAMVAPVAFVGVLVVTHLTDIYDTALRHQFVHDVEHVAYFLAACALWALVLGAGRRRGVDRMAAVFAVIAGMAFLGAILMTADHALIDSYAAQAGATDALDDQRLAAAIMWVTGMAITLPLLLLTVWRWATMEQNIAERREALERAAGPTPRRRPP